MNAAALSPDAARLKAVRASLDAITPGDWTRAHDENGALIEARGAYGELLVLARFDAASVDEQAFAADAPDMVRFLLRLLDQAFAKIRDMTGAERSVVNMPAPGREKKLAAECAMRCKDARFKRFLEERHGLEPPLTDDRSAQKVRSILGVQSRGEIDDGGRAGDAWRALRASFNAWLKAGT